MHFAVLMFVSSKTGNDAVLHFQAVLNVELTLLFKRLKVPKYNYRE